MSLLTMIQQALKEIGEFEVPATIISNTNPTATQFLALAQREGRELSRRHHWQALVTEKTQTLTNGTEGYDLPSDTRFVVHATYHDRTNRYPMQGPLNASDWQFLKAEAATGSRNRFFRTRGDQILIYPTPTAADTIAYEYVSDQYCESASGTAQNAWAADTDVGKLDEELMEAGLIWRFLQAKGLPAERQRGEYETLVTRAIARDGSKPTLQMGRRAGLRSNSYIPNTNSITWSNTVLTWGS